MTRKNYILTAISLLFVAAYSYAGNRTVEEAQKAAMELLQRNAPRRAKGQTITAPAKPRLVATKQRQGNGAYYYVFSNGEGKGYTMVSGDDRLPEIMCYTEKGDYSEPEMPQAFSDMLQKYLQCVDSMTERQAAEIKNVRAKSASRETVVPLLKTNWTQGENFMCPVMHDGSRATVGCTPLAIAQVLKYYNCPKVLKKEIPAYTTASILHLEMPAIPAGEVYDWDNMLDDYILPGTNTIIATQEQKDAVGKLTLHVGCAVRANYTSSATSAFLESSVLVDYFGMDPELTRKYYRAGHTLNEWDDLTYSEIHDKRPVLFTGYGGKGGHTFILHGYKDGMYAVDWGWGLAVDGYYDISLLGEFTGKNEMVFTQPDNGVKDDVLYSALPSLGGDVGNVQDKEVANGVFSGKCYFSWQTELTWEVTRYLSVGYRDAAGNVMNIGEPQQQVVPAHALSVIYAGSVGVPFSLAYEEGRSYELILIESDDKVRWVPCEQRTPWSTVAVTVRDGKVTLDDGATLTATAALDTASCGYAGFDNTLNVTVENKGPRNYYSQLHIYVSRDSEQPTTPAFRQSVSVTPGGTFTLPVSLVGSWYEEPGEYNVWIWACVKPGTGYNGTEYIGHGTFTLTKSPPADLRLRGVRVVNATGEKVFAEFRNGKHEDSPHLYEMDKVEGTEAVFEFDIENVGGYYHENYVVMNEYRVAKTGYADSEGNSIIAPCFTDVLTPECYDFTMLAGERRTFTVSTTAHVNGVAGMQVWNGVKDLETPIEHRRKDSPYPYTFRRADICYLAGTASGVRDASLPDVPAVVAVGGKGCITIGANASAPVSVVSASGAVVRRLALRAGEKVTLALAPGVYAVGERKVVVR